MTLETRQAYRRIMDAVTVTPEVERRVLAGLRTALETGQKPAYRRWQPRLAAACAALVICAAAGFPLWLDSRTPAETPPVQVTWSAQQFESTGELAEQLSYPLLLPAWLPEGYALESARCLQGELAEVCWQNRWADHHLPHGAGGWGRQRGLHRLRLGGGADRRDIRCYL